MKIWYFSENAYPYLPPPETYNFVRVDLPNKHYDPVKGAALYDRFIDEWVLATEEGMEIMMNEHHQNSDLRRSGGAAGAWRRWLA